MELEERVNLVIKKINLFIRVIVLIIFIGIILTFLLGTIKIFSYEFTSKSAMWVVWILWWPLLYLTLFFLGRSWCGFLCPLRFTNQLGNKLNEGKLINFRKWSFIPFVLFFIVVYIEQISGLFLSTKITLSFFIGFLILSILTGIFLKRGLFCRLFCPIGTLLGVFSRLSIIGVRVRKKICEKCSEKWCILGRKEQPCPMFNDVPNIQSNKDCLICTNCIKNCPYSSAHIGITRPGKEIENRINFTLSESYFIIALLGLSFILTNKGVFLIRKIILLFNLEVTGYLLRGFDFVFSIGIFLLVFSLFGIVCAKLNQIKLKGFLTESGYYYLPIVFGIMFFTIFFGFLGPTLHFKDGFISYSKAIILIISGMWSAYLIKKAYSNFFVKILQLIFLIIIFSLWALLLIPANIDTQNTEVTVTPGEIIHMNAYSMGFSPNIINIKVDTKTVMEIKNLDFTHSFDIDELNVHEILKGDSTTLVEFTPKKTGEFLFTCNLPGHTEAGMKGKIVVN